MVKPKVKQPPFDTDDCVQDGWVIVKKQKVTILIPPLPVTEQCTMANMGGAPTQLIATEEIDHITPPQPIATEEIDHITPSQPESPLTIEKTMPFVKIAPNIRKTSGVCSALKTRKRCGNLNGHVLMNSKMRALNLERKLKKAGGLDSWLVSLGLGQFVKIFRCKRVGKMQLVNLTMKKLKDMGADAVGPRRKLMHAIDCLW